METSSEIKNIAEALRIFQKAVGAVEKDSVNPFFKSKYASFESVVGHIKQPMYACGLSFAQFPDADGLTTIVMHASGEWIIATAKLIVKDQTPQGLGSAITYMRRYALSAALGLATEDDDDGNGAPVAPKQPLGAKQAPKVGNAVKDPAIALKAAKDRVRFLVDKLTEGDLIPTDKDELKKWYGDQVYEMTGLSLPLAHSLEEFEAIGQALSEVADKQK